ncbi:hypothetical protein HC028_06610 [Planosporangium flavigriseum]|uniref:Uncharacterized protein n=1 Tax=Planosporangium flavigriseum TaxID=373681 RepID=A0A8J3LW02_9ACTN|nr:hypothetical protein [Planosporangium flavigriseum]NJC64183.1 hypothetical protein [Planosporangium flavigriseum]GIG74335.1 hypothetical protein Pfl04_27390 [Planosporangium flavigriseum]
MTVCPNSPHEVGNRIAIAKVTLSVHRIQAGTGRCEACGRECPCDAANNAANTLAAYGLPVTEPQPQPQMRNQRRFLRSRKYLNWR